MLPYSRCFFAREPVLKPAGPYFFFHVLVLLLEGTFLQRVLGYFRVSLGLLTRYSVQFPELLGSWLPFSPRFYTWAEDFIARILDRDVLCLFFAASLALLTSSRVAGYS